MHTCRQMTVGPARVRARPSGRCGCCGGRGGHGGAVDQLEGGGRGVPDKGAQAVDV